MALVVIGLGNADRGDDAAGVLAARALRPLLPGARVVEESRDGTVLPDHWGPADDVVLIDAMSPSDGLPAGAVVSFDARARPLPVGRFAATTHAFGAAEGIELARSLGRLPATLVVYGIAGGSFGPGASVSPLVAAAAEDVARTVAARAPSVSAGRGREASGRRHRPGRGTSPRIGRPSPSP